MKHVAQQRLLVSEVPDIINLGCNKVKVLSAVDYVVIGVYCNVNISGLIILCLAEHVIIVDHNLSLRVLKVSFSSGF